MRRLPLLAALGLVALPCLAEVCAPYIETYPGETNAAIRPHSTAFLTCPVSEETYRQVIEAWLGAGAPASTRLTSLSLGRAVSFPWISRYLSDAALRQPRWIKHIARGSSGEHNAFVASLLSEPRFLERLDRPFAGTSYRVVGVSVEKVLIGKAKDYASAMPDSKLPVPFDAQIWLELVPRR